MRMSKACLRDDSGPIDYENYLCADGFAIWRRIYYSAFQCFSTASSTDWSL
jgi:hypothetical protein